MVRMHQGWALYSKHANILASKFLTLKFEIPLIQNKYGHTGHQERIFYIYECL